MNLLMNMYNTLLVLNNHPIKNQILMLIYNYYLKHFLQNLIMNYYLLKIFILHNSI